MRLLPLTTKTYHQFIPYTDRLDYLAPMSNNTAYALTIEKILDIEVTERCKWLRVMLCELARISSHLLGIGAMALDLGASTPFLWARARQKRRRAVDKQPGSLWSFGPQRPRWLSVAASH